MEHHTKLQLVLETIDIKNITAYRIATETGLSAVGVQKIINGEVNPHAKTLNVIYDFILNMDKPKLDLSKSEIDLLIGLVCVHKFTVDRSQVQNFDSIIKRLTKLKAE